jgi:hyperosmotically inducible protein
MRASTRIGAAVLAAFLALARPRAAAASTPDAWITTKAKMALLATEGLRRATINVDTVNGHVTLHGRVRTADEKATAEDAVRKIDGVKDVRNILQVVGGSRERLVKRADSEIRDGVEKALGTDRALVGSRGAVRSVNDGVVLLAGRANTMSEHLRAMGDAARVPGVRRVASEIESPNELTDEEIGRDNVPLAQENRGMTDAARDLLVTSATKLRLLADSRTPALDINVDTTDGDLTLFGMVPSNEAKEAAEEDARGVSGVKRVINMLQVVHPAKQEAVKASDQALERDIKAALASRPDLSDSRIAVEVKNGVARLSGTVPSQEERLAAALTARSAVGVKSVQDDLRVSTRTDAHPLAPVPDGEPR